MIRTVKGKGIFTVDPAKSLKTIGLFRNSLDPEPHELLFESGIRAVCRERGYHAVDFGAFDNLEAGLKIINHIEEYNYQGVLSRVSMRSVMNTEDYMRLFNSFVEKNIMYACYNDTFAMHSHQVSMDHYACGYQIGEKLAGADCEGVYYLGGQNPATLSRLYGLRDSLNGKFKVVSNLVDFINNNFVDAIMDAREKFKNWSVVIGTPAPNMLYLNFLENIPWRAGSGHELAVVIEENQQVPDKIPAHLMIKQESACGRCLANMLLDAIENPYDQGAKAKIIHYKYKMN
jgi:hypothetical protein